MTAVRDPAQRRTATLIVRVWAEADGEIRARLLTAERGRAGATWHIAVGVPAITDAVHRWLVGVLPDGPDEPADPDG